MRNSRETLTLDFGRMDFIPKETMFERFIYLNSLDDQSKISMILSLIAKGHCTHGIINLSGRKTWKFNVYGDLVRIVDHCGRLVLSLKTSSAREYSYYLYKYILYNNDDRRDMYYDRMKDIICCR